MKKFKKYMFMIIFCIFPSIMNVQYINASTERKDSHTADFFFTKTFDHSYKISNLVSYSYPLYISKNMKNIEIQANLSFLMSTIPIGKDSSITFYINEIPIYSRTFDQLRKNSHFNLKLNSSVLQDGNNIISIRGKINSTREQCEINEDINWAVIKKGSTIQVKYHQKNPETLSEFFEGTLCVDENEYKTFIALPDQLSNEDYTIGATLAASIGYHNRTGNEPSIIKTISYSQVLNMKHPVIVVGMKHEILNFYKKISFSNQSSGSVISIEELNGISHIFVGLEDIHDLQYLTTILENPQLLKQLDKKQYILQETFHTNTSIKTTGNISDFGYTPSSLMGSGIQIFDYYVPLTNKKIMLDTNEFIYQYHYSENIEFADSYVTVYVNDEPIKTQPLKKSKAAQDTITFSIPKRLYDYSAYNIRLQFHLNKKLLCEGKITNSNWITVDTNKSYYYVTFTKRHHLQLMTSPLLIQNNDGKVDGSIGIHVNDINLDNLFDFCYYLGKSAFGVKQLNLVPLTPGNTYEYPVIIGNTTSSFIQSLNYDLPIQLNTNGNIIPTPEFQQLIGNIGIIQMTKNRNTLVIAATDQEHLHDTLKRYTKGFSKNTISSVIQNGEETFVSMRNTTDIKLTLEQKLNSINKAAVILLAILIMILFLFAKQVKRKA